MTKISHKGGPKKKFEIFEKGPLAGPALKRAACRNLIDSVSDFPNSTATFVLHNCFCFAL